MEADEDTKTAPGATTVEDIKPEAVPAAKERDNEFWYEDGNVILVAGNVKFRVFKGILAHHSPVFKDMFTLPQPDAAPSENVACPIVDLTDSLSDLRHILRLIMPKTEAK